MRRQTTPRLSTAYLPLIHQVITQLTRIIMTTACYGDISPRTMAFVEKPGIQKHTIQHMVLQRLEVRDTQLKMIQMQAEIDRLKAEVERRRIEPTTAA
jgi:uncharacterized small protein (DUF1192 family)